MIEGHWPSGRLWVSWALATFAATFVMVAIAGVFIVALAAFFLRQARSVGLTAQPAAEPS
jgi:hypothetical protein